ncbi:DUF4188 domain-containing protein [Streptomyces sp. TRM66268-LWL]|uniref:DUF4188 domain-containing protein n=1 Tax=Streptomyces polyasparticus TaxID=2767826 RepID=A0ABR7S9I0_9ACTN|nr:DUF4188 domain-containing protein [Streptomyces polyasparticus]MBC9711602.1 DUF4188 domain-containing protein [Streptomyces polyasparticus]
MSTEVIAERRVAAAEGDVVVFLIGMRINKLRKVRSWLPVFLAMPKMLRELSEDKESGLLGYRLMLGGPRLFTVVQYWESKEKLLEYAKDTGRKHRPAWTAYNRSARNAGAAAGIWHETYLVPAGRYENIYVNMPEFGLGAAYGTQPVGRRGDRAADRLKVA